MNQRILLSRADITTLTVDVIVNAANSALCGGGGVDGAIHRAAGPGLLEECRGLGLCPAGDAVVTSAYNLNASWVIHAVGPVWNGGEYQEAELLKSAYGKSLLLAHQLAAKTLAFPAISCGIYRYPIKDAARIATQTVATFLHEHDLPYRVVLCCTNPDVLEAYKAALDEL